MSSTIPGFNSPAAGPEAPLEMLSACHARMERQCETLRRLLSHLPAHGVDEQARSAAAALLKYFDTAAPQHHADEEQDLFPALLEAMAGSDAVCLRQMTQSLAAEHRELEHLWSRLRPGLESIAAGTAAALPADEAIAFVERYASHLRREDDELLPMAQRLLDDHQIQEIGQAMRHRRGIPDRW